MDSDTKRRLDRIEAKLDDALERINLVRQSIGYEEDPHASLVVTRQQAARELGVPLRRLNRLIATGRLAAITSGVSRTQLGRIQKNLGVKLKSW